MIPDQLRLVPVYLMMVDFPVTDWNLTQTLHGYVFFGTSIALATNLFLMRQYFLTIPKDYEEAAKLDGAGYFKTYWRDDAAARGAGRGGVAILTFQGIWNEFFWANLLLGQGSSSNWTVQIGVAQFRFTVPDALAAAHGRGDDRDHPRARRLRLLPALLRRGRRRGRGEGMNDGRSRPLRRTRLGSARFSGARSRDFYEESWRLVAPQLACSRPTSSRCSRSRRSVPLALVLLLGAGSIAAALVSAAVIVVETGSLTFVGDGRDDPSLLAPRARARGARSALGVLATVIAFRFYGSAGTLAWPLAVLVLYLGGIFVLYQLVLWPLAVRDCERPLRDGRRRGGRRSRRRPGAVARTRARAARRQPGRDPRSPSSRS